MDIISHGLWAGAAAECLRRRSGRRLGVIGWAVVLGMVPDVVSVLPVMGWALFQPDTFGLVYSYIVATPGKEPVLPATVIMLAHHSHCIMHSAVIALVVALLAWWLHPSLLLPLVGWWLHIAVDIPTHSNHYYAVPFLYPFTYWGFDGIPWTTPWLLAVDYIAIAMVYGALFASRRVRVSASSG